MVLRNNNFSQVWALRPCDHLHVTNDAFVKKVTPAVTPVKAGVRNILSFRYFIRSRYNLSVLICYAYQAATNGQKISRHFVPDGPQHLAADPPNNLHVP